MNSKLFVMTAAAAANWSRMKMKEKLFLYCVCVSVETTKENVVSSRGGEQKVKWERNKVILVDYIDEIYLCRASVLAHTRIHINSPDK